MSSPVMTDAEKLIEALREIGFEPAVRDVSYTEDFRGLAAPRQIRRRVNVGFHFLFDEDGKLAGVESEYDGWVTSTSEDAIAVVGYRTECVNGLGRRVTAVDLVFRDATHARKLLSLRESTTAPQAGRSTCSPANGPFGRTPSCTRFISGTRTAGRTSSSRA